MARRILIIEDEVSIAELEKDYLELSGFEVVMKNDGISGQLGILVAAGAFFVCHVFQLLYYPPLCAGPACSGARRAIL